MKLLLTLAASVAATLALPAAATSGAHAPVSQVRVRGSETVDQLGDVLPGTSAAVLPWRQVARSTGVVTALPSSLSGVPVDDDAIIAAKHGVVCDGYLPNGGGLNPNPTDNAAAIQALITGQSGYAGGKKILLPPGLCMIGSTLKFYDSFDVKLAGAGRDKTIITPIGSGVLPIQVGNPADSNPWTATVKTFTTQQVEIDDLTIDTRGKAIGNVAVDRSSTEIRFERDAFVGDAPSGDLVYDQGDTQLFVDDTFDPQNTGLWALEFDTWGHNSKIIYGTLYSGATPSTSGNGVRITQSGWSPAIASAAGITDPRAVYHRIEGLFIDHFTTVALGQYGIQIGNSLSTYVTNSTIDQTTVNAISIMNNADSTVIDNTYAGTIGHTPTANAYIGIYVAPSAGNGTKLTHNTFYNNDIGIFVDATSSQAVHDVYLEGNNCDFILHTCIALDSVTQGIVMGTMDVSDKDNGIGTEAWGSLNTKATKGHGAYIVSGNVFSTTTPSFFDTSSTYVTTNIGGPSGIPH